MALVKYVSKMEIHLQSEGGKLTYMGDIQRVRISSKSGDNAVHTFGGAGGKGGLAGFTDGPFETEITFTKAVPKAGEEFDLLQVMLDHKNVVVKGKVGKKRRTYEGRIMTNEEDFDLQKASTSDVRIVCGEPETTN